MMGSGKSTVGQTLARLANREFFDTDKLLVQRLGRPIAEFFRYYGEDAFRDHEYAVLTSMEPAPIVLATGGGIVIQDRNWDELRRIGTTVYLDAPFEVLKERVERGKRRRPLLQAENWEERLESILNSRKDWYERADICFKVGDSNLPDTAQRLYEVLCAQEQRV
jgi:shikimate kinase